MQIIHLKFYNNFMEIKTYKKDSFYTYILGAFPTIELLKNHPEEILKIVVSSSFKNQEVINLINSLRGNKEMAIRYYNGLADYYKQLGKKLEYQKYIDIIKKLQAE